MIERRTFAAIGAGLAFIGVAGGAFGAHFLEGRVSGELLEVFETAVEYQMYHAFGLLLVGGLSPQPHAALNQWAGKLFVVGTIVFSGSLYLLALTGARWLGAITPIGGVCLLAGWGALCWSLISRPKMDAQTGDGTSRPQGG